MSELITLRINNIVDYHGNHGVSRDVTIISIEEVQENISIYRLERPYGDNKFIDAQRTEIEGILLRGHHMGIVGFKFDETLIRYHLNDISIGQFNWATGTDRLNLSGVQTNFRIIPFGFPQQPSIDEVNKGTIGVNYLHEFQNYCEDKKAGVDFSPINHYKYPNIHKA